MAKKQDLTGLFARTEPKTEPQAQDDPVKPVGIGLKQSEWITMDSIAAELGLTRHKLAMYALREFMRRYENGEIKTETRPKLPGA